MPQVPRELASHPDRLRWNARYETGSAASFAAHPLMVRALSAWLPGGPVLDLASGPSGSALLAAGAGRRVTAVDAAEVALGLLSREAHYRGLSDLITVVHADLATWRPQPDSYALVLCTGYWEQAVFSVATTAVLAGGLLAWEAFTADARRARPGLPAQWCLNPGEPASLLAADYEVLGQHDVPNGERGTKRWMLARRHATARAAADDHGGLEHSGRPAAGQQDVADLAARAQMR
jgi:hypothetical protein